MTDYLLLSFIFLAAGVAAVSLATRLGLDSVLGYLIAGIMLSPLLAILDVDVLSLQHFAEFGMVMMLFLVGLELEPKRLWRLRHRPIGLISAQACWTSGAIMESGSITDATRPDLLEAASIGQAKLLIVAIDGREQIKKLVQHVLKHSPHAHVIARAWDRNHIFELYAMGCRDITRETYDSAIRTWRSALEALGVSGEYARHLAAEFEVLDRNMMEKVAGLHSIDHPNHENPEYVAKMKELNAELEELLRGKIISMHIGCKGFNRQSSLHFNSGPPWLNAINQAD